MLGENRRINLFEPTVDGHRSRYLSEIVLGVRQKYPSCTLRLCVVESQLGSDGYQEFLKPLEDRFEFCPLLDLRYRGRFTSEFAKLKLLSDCISKYPCDDLVIPSGDGIVPLMGMMPRWILRRLVPAGVRLESMVFRPEWAYSSHRIAHRMYHNLRRRATCRWPGDRLHVSDFNAWKRVENGTDNYVAEVSLIPEVFEAWEPWGKDRALEWLYELGFLPKGILDHFASFAVINAPGAPSLRKGTVPLIEAFVKASELHAVLLIWGKIPEDVDEQLMLRGVPWQEDERIVIIEPYVTEEAFRALFSITDLVVLPYQSHLGGVSSLFLISVIFQLKTICDQRAWLGWASEHYRHGLAIDSSDAAFLSRSLRSALGNDSIPIATDLIANALRQETMEGGFRGKWC